EIPAVYGDDERVIQILGNLLENAYNYTPENGTIKVSIQYIFGRIQVSVKDSGIGIFPDDQARIFDRFFRGENSMVYATAGTGLGLAIVKQLVDMHKGEIWVESSGIPGEGSTFSFTLPTYDEMKKEENMG
ncbi:MAG: ATP-binding protein, partial [Anaerolineae bacterium]|nr:ATP-binding protein [Anaerolineae bacterium]